MKNFREFLSESKDYVKLIKDQISQAKKDFPKSEFEQKKQVISYIKKLPKNIELAVKDPKLQKMGFDQTPYVHAGNGNFETKVNGKVNSVTADKIVSFLNESRVKISLKNDFIDRIFDDVKKFENDIEKTILNGNISEETILRIYNDNCAKDYGKTIYLADKIKIDLFKKVITIFIEENTRHMNYEREYHLSDVLKITW